MRINTVTFVRENEVIKDKPGSERALEFGCMCPVIDNHYGAGIQGRGEEKGWLVNRWCKIHNEDFVEKRRD